MVKPARMRNYGASRLCFGPLIIAATRSYFDAIQDEQAKMLQRATYALIYTQATLDSSPASKVQVNAGGGGNKKCAANRELAANLEVAKTLRSN